MGAAVGLCIAMPIGPVDILCIRNTLSWGKRYGFVTGMGAAVTHAIYGAIAGLGVVALTSLLMTYIFWFKVVGGLFLCYLGLTTLLGKSETDQVRTGKGTLARLFLTAFFITMANPFTVLSLLAIYTAFGLGGQDITSYGIILLTTGVFLGSTLWWLILSFSARLFRNHFTEHWFRWLYRISGIALLLFGVVALFI